MKAALTYGKGKIVVEEIDRPVPQADEVLIRVHAAGICGGDIRIYKGTFPYSIFPLINGHELSGHIEQVGDNVKSITPGTRVVLDPIRPCGKCYACRIGKSNCCNELKVTGVHVNGAFAEYLTAPAERVHVIPDSIDDITGSLIEPYAIAMHAVNLVNIEPDEWVLVLGAGPIGLAIIDVCKLRGAKVILSEPMESRLKFAEKYEPDLMVNPKKDDLAEVIMKHTEGCGVPAVMEATGVPSVMASTQDYVANGGRIGLVGVTDGEVSFHGVNFSKKELNIYGSRNSRGVFPELIKLVEEGKLHPEHLISHRFSLGDIQTAMETAAYKSEEVCKIVITIGEARNERES